ncbi:hypothetical protein PR202_ga04330 [Eleusine coracana subsp. coracana]|uniref:Saposin B-type domain-containing protein n=1 Tax=Eleusine coracana subsp. coracana TaxID=191504 RepID=A0AAV5BRC6_ELECO|nr:hypothetical protein PR202_ga04330 [Eleusine coracana subsp. coracana]
MEALFYLKENETQTEIINTLHQACSKFPSFKLELKIIEVLLKGCNNTENFVQKCKRMIIQNAPVILEHIKKFLKKRDFCNSIHVCRGKTPHAGSQVVRSLSTA